MKKIVALVLVSVVFMNMFPMETDALEGHNSEDYLLFIPDWREEWHDGMKIMDAGMEYNLTFSRYSDNITVILYSERNNHTRNRTYYYEWRYSNGNFSDVLYGRYINKSACSVFKNKSGDRVSFHIAIYSRADGAIDANGTTWHLIVKSMYDVTIDDLIYVRRSIVDISQSGAEFVFKVNPDTEYSNYIGDIYNHGSFVLRNGGNIPIYIKRDFDPYLSIINVTNIDRIFGPGEKKRCNVTLKPLYWDAQILNIEEKIIAIPLHVFSGEQITFNTTLSFPLKITIKVSEEGFDIIKAGKAYLQYRYYGRPIEADFNETLAFDLYLSGNGSADLSILPDELQIVGVYYHGKWHNRTSGHPTDINFDLNGKEEHVKVAVRCYIENITAKLKYRLKQGNFSEDSSYTYIKVGKAPFKKNSKEKLEINQIGLAIAVIFIILLFSIPVHNSLKSRREKDKNKEEYQRHKGRKKRSRK
jgi:hypothetical protein